MSSLKWLAAFALALSFAQPAVAAPPLIYEGTLTTDGVAPNSWPALRFSIVDNDGNRLWSSVVDEEGPISRGVQGHFIVYLDMNDDDGPLPPTVAEAGAALQVDVCLARENQPGCDWLPLEASQRLGQIPIATTARLAPPPREVFAVDPVPVGEPWASSSATAVAPVDGVYLIGATYSCYSSCDPEDGANAPGRPPEEQLWIDGVEVINRTGHKRCNANEPFEEKFFLPVLRHLDRGQSVRFTAVGWGCNHYRYANLSLSAISQDDLSAAGN